MELPNESFPHYKIDLTEDQKPYIRLPYHDKTTLLFLTEFYDTDADALTETLNIEDVNNALISVPKPYKVDHAHYFIKQQQHPAVAVPFLQVIRLDHPRLGKLVGSVSLTPQQGGAGNRYELGYYLHPDLQRRGIMRGVVRTVLRYGFQEKGAHSVDVKIREDNLSSRKIVECIPEFKLVGEETVEWPAKKGGGGSSTLLVWRMMPVPTLLAAVPK